jgi:hypothetical protein
MNWHERKSFRAKNKANLVLVIENEFSEDENGDEEEASSREIKIRAAHEIMAARTTQLAFLVDQFMSALRTKPPVLAGNIFTR